MGGYFSCSVAQSKEEAIGLVHEDLEAFQRRWKADWWETRVRPGAEKVLPHDDGWEPLLRIYLQSNPSAEVPKELWHGFAWIHS